MRWSSACANAGATDASRREDAADDRGCDPSDDGPASSRMMLLAALSTTTSEDCMLVVSSICSLPFVPTSGVNGSSADHRYRPKRRCFRRHCDGESPPRRFYARKAGTLNRHVTVASTGAGTGRRLQRLAPDEREDEVAALLDDLEAQAVGRVARRVVRRVFAAIRATRWGCPASRTARGRSTPNCPGPSGTRSAGRAVCPARSLLSRTTSDRRPSCGRTRSSRSSPCRPRACRSSRRARLGVSIDARYLDPAWWWSGLPSEISSAPKNDDLDSRTGRLVLEQAGDLEQDADSRRVVVRPGDGGFESICAPKIRRSATRTRHDHENVLAWRSARKREALRLRLVSEVPQTAGDPRAALCLLRRARPSDAEAR